MSADQNPSPTTPIVASSRRYIILGSVALVVILASLMVVLRRPAAPSSSNTLSNSPGSTTQITGDNRPTFERFQAAKNAPVNTAPIVTQPTLEQTQQAIKELQQQ